MKKLTIFFVMIVILLCGSFQASAEGETIRALLVGGASGIARWEHIIPIFEEKTGIKVQYETLDTQAMRQKEIILVATKDDTYDVYGTHFAHIGFFSEHFFPLDDYLNDDYLNDVMISAIEPFKNKRTEKIVALPLFMDARLMYYRKDHFAEAGIETPPKTWDELISVAQKLTTGERYGLGIVGAGNPLLRQYSDFLWQAGGDFISFDDNEPLFNSKEGLKALKYYVDLLRKYKVVPPDTVGMMWPENTQIFSQGLVSITFNWPSHEATIRQTLGPELYGFAPLPSDITSDSTAVAHGIAVNKYGHESNREAAVEFVKFASSPEMQVDLYKLQRQLPVTDSAWEKVINLAIEESEDEYERILALKEVCEYGKTWPVTEAWEEFMADFWTILEQALAGVLTPEEALDKAEEKYREILNKQ